MIMIGGRNLEGEDEVLWFDVAVDEVVGVDVLDGI